MNQDYCPPLEGGRVGFERLQGGGFRVSRMNPGTLKFVIKDLTYEFTWASCKINSSVAC